MNTFSGESQRQSDALYIGDAYSHVVEQIGKMNKLIKQNLAKYNKLSKVKRRLKFSI